MGRHTVTGMLSAAGSQFVDWSAAYRVFSKERFNAQDVMDRVLGGVVECLPQQEPLVVALDSSLLRKKGMRTHGVRYLRDPLGPPFHVNLVRAQRVLQMSAALPAGDGRARMIPVDFVLDHSPRKPRKNAPLERWREYREQYKRSNICSMASGRLEMLRQRMDGQGHQREMIAVGDGGFTNGRMMKKLPGRMTFIGRLRADAKLYRLPEQNNAPARGRRRIYGAPLPTPEQIRRDESIPWQTVRIHAAGKWHDFRFKTLSPLRWRATGDAHDLRLVVIAPLGYRIRKGAPIAFRKPAYLICTDPDLPLDRLIQSYIWRWDIEVNFRDEKTLLGVGQAQVRTPSSVEGVPQLIVAAYATLLLAAKRAFAIANDKLSLPKPKWRAKRKKPRTTTSDLIQQMRAEMWGKALGIDNFSDFATQPKHDTKYDKIKPDLASAVLYACA